MNVKVPLAWSEAVKVASFGDFASGVQALKLEFLGPTLELTPDGNKTQPASSVPPLCAQGTFGYGFIRSARYCGQPVVVKNLGAAAVCASLLVLSFIFEMKTLVRGPFVLLYSSHSCHAPF